jgi:adenosylhomocysteine nucleosidase
MTILIICAVKIELDVLINRLKAVVSDAPVGMKCWDAVHGTHPVKIVQCGVGKVNAALAVQQAFARWDIDMVINAGVAGNLSSRNKVGDVILGERLAYHDVYVNNAAVSYPMKAIFRADGEHLSLLETAGTKRYGTIVKRGFIVTGDSFIDSKERKVAILKEHDADCVDMESAAVAHACLLNKKKFLVIRSLSDDAENNAYATFLDFIKDAAEKCSHCLMDYLDLL